MDTQEKTLEVKVMPYVGKLAPETVSHLIEQGQSHLFEWLSENAPPHINDLATGLAILDFLQAKDEDGEGYHPLAEFDELLISFLNALAIEGWW